MLELKATAQYVCTLMINESFLDSDSKSLQDTIGHASDCTRRKKEQGEKGVRFEPCVEIGSGAICVDLTT